MSNLAFSLPSADFLVLTNIEELKLLLKKRDIHSNHTKCEHREIGLVIPSPEGFQFQVDLSPSLLPIEPLCSDHIAGATCSCQSLPNPNLKHSPPPISKRAHASTDKQPQKLGHKSTSILTFISITQYQATLQTSFTSLNTIPFPLPLPFKHMHNLL
jgi:hypothetical protein